jgi:hypothetical protein
MRILSFLASLLVIPLALLLFIQWPLREWVQAYSRQANDMGQILFDCMWRSPSRRRPYHDRT